MKKIVAVLLVSGTILCTTNHIALAADSFTTGFTFTLPETFPLHNVYVGVQQGATGFEDVLLPGNPTIDVSGITPAGFDVPVGNSSFDLNSLFDVPADRWAVVGLFTDAGGVDHVVMATNADLTGVPLNFPLIPLGFDEDLMITSLTTGVGLISLGGGIVETLGDNGFMRPFGETAQLFFFSDGQPIPDSSATANAFGVPGVQQAIPGPSAVLLLGAGFLGLLGYGRRRRKQSA